MNCTSDNPTVLSVTYAAWLMNEVGMALQRLSVADTERLGIPHATVADLVGTACVLRRIASEPHKLLP